MVDHRSLISEKKSFYDPYRELKYQELSNPKNKFDNRLYFSHRYKLLSYHHLYTDELLKMNFNRDTFRNFGMVLINI
jgi:hypothetical protein